LKNISLIGQNPDPELVVKGPGSSRTWIPITDCNNSPSFHFKCSAELKLEYSRGANIGKYAPFTREGGYGTGSSGRKTIKRGEKKEGKMLKKTKKEENIQKV
jgi:hypothetical protein